MQPEGGQLPLDGEGRLLHLGTGHLALGGMSLHCTALHCTAQCDCRLQSTGFMWTDLRLPIHPSLGLCSRFPIAADPANVSHISSLFEYSHLFPSSAPAPPTAPCPLIEPSPANVCGLNGANLSQPDPMVKGKKGGMGFLFTTL